MLIMASNLNSLTKTRSGRVAVAATVTKNLNTRQVAEKNQEKISKDVVESSSESKENVDKNSRRVLRCRKNSNVPLNKENTKDVKNKMADEENKRKSLRLSSNKCNDDKSASVDSSIANEVSKCNQPLVDKKGKPGKLKNGSKGKEKLLNVDNKVNDIKYNAKKCNQGKDGRLRSLNKEKEIVRDKKLEDTETKNTQMGKVERVSRSKARSNDLGVTSDNNKTKKQNIEVNSSFASKNETDNNEMGRRTRSSSVKNLSNDTNIKKTSISKKIRTKQTKEEIKVSNESNSINQGTSDSGLKKSLRNSTVENSAKELTENSPDNQSKRKNEITKVTNENNKLEKDLNSKSPVPSEHKIKRPLRISTVENSANKSSVKSPDKQPIRKNEITKMTKENNKTRKDINSEKTEFAEHKAENILCSSSTENSTEKSPNKLQTRKSSRIKTSDAEKCAKPARTSIPKRVQFDVGLNTRKKRINYFELSGLSQDSQEDKKVPIYKQPIKIHEKKTKDIYELNISDEKIHSSDSDDDYDKNIKVELKQIKQLEKKKQNKVVKRLRKLKTTRIKEAEAAKKITKSSENPAKTNLNKNRKKLVVVLDNKVIKEWNKNSKDFGFEECPNQEDLSVNIENFSNRSVGIIPLEQTLPTPQPRKKTKDDSYFNFKRPILNDLNSTMATNKNQSGSPWRPSLVYKKGPYLLNYKTSSALPTYNQDSVLNSSMSIAPLSSTPYKKSAKSRIEKQSSILKFVKSSKAAEEDSPARQNCTLFDENLLPSPVKMAQSPEKAPLKDVTNVFTNRLLNTMENESVEDDSDFLPTFLRSENRTAAVASGKPVRLPSPKKKPVENKEVEMAVEQEKLPSVFESPVSQKDDPPEALVGIFEDFLEVSKPNITYKNKKRHAQNVSYDSATEDEEYSFEKLQKPKAQRKKRPKDQMTKEELKRYEEWAKQFNKMCEEVEKFPLEIITEN